MRLLHLSYTLFTLSVIFFFFPDLSLMASEGQRSVKVQGHRGSRGTFPENTLSSFQAALEAGADAIELDLLVTQDGEIVIHHDFRVNQKTSIYLNEQPITQSFLIRDLSLSQIKEIDCGRLVNPDFPRQQSCPKEHIPTLEELFHFLNTSSHPLAKKIGLNLEIKRDPRYPEWTIHPKECVAKIISLVYKNSYQDRVCYTSFDPEILSYVRAFDPHASIGFIFNDETLSVLSCTPQHWVEPIIQLAASFKANMLSIDHTLLTDARFIQALKQAGYRILAWTANTPEEWKKLIQLGVEGIITDYPQDLVTFLKQ